ncbi:helix-turn-helix transcriptional regulator [Streptomyces sp. NPDC005865]|uniref:helix-turn-helix domain-containing protein n=1 Tax=Streptomyces sp. NPDC005865 TaxID=3155453 RepID=UPI0033C2A52C
MARPEQSISTANPRLEYLAEWLRGRRRAAGLTHREMAEKSGHAFSATTFSRATSGDRIPRLPVVEAYARACGAPAGQARRLWRAARWAEHRRRNPGAREPKPDRVYDRDQLGEALRQLYYKAGAMSAGEMERRAGGHGELPHSTVLRMLAGRTVFDLAQFLAFLRVCDVTDGVEWERWRSAWFRVRSHEAVERMAEHLSRTHEASARNRRDARDRNNPGPEATATPPWPPAAPPGEEPPTPHPRRPQPYPAVSLAMPRNRRRR